MPDSIPNPDDYVLHEAFSQKNPNRGSAFFDRFDSNFFEFLGRAGLPENATDAEIASHMEETGVFSVQHPDYL